MNIKKKVALNIARQTNVLEKKRVLPHEIFALNCFGKKEQKQRLPKEIYKKLQDTIQNRNTLDENIADVVASAMKSWAVENGATYYTHWFQPLTGSTAEKHDSFLTIDGQGQAILNLSGKELIQGEPDASSFPSGGIRATFEARGYTAWDPTSYAFIRNTAFGATLFIPTAYFSYTGDALDLKTPLLRSQEAISKSAVKALKLFNKEVDRVNTTSGLEQEFFVIDAEYYNLRPDLIATGRTLFGSSPLKGQELSDHYFGSMKKRVVEFINDAEQELLKLGVPVKTRHNEVAPAQYEIAPIFEDANLAVDHNLLVMDVLKDMAIHHKLRVILHEKPFAGVNGSGKHCNWSMSDSTGSNLLDPGHDATENQQFIFFLSCIVRAVDKYAHLLRISIASAGNDHRLGANEAPPAIISIFLGEHLENVMQSIITGNPTTNNSGQKMELGVSVLPTLPRDNTDRNRTSPFAFTGNKFEFRALGSSQSPSSPNYILNTIVTESIDVLVDQIQQKISAGSEQTKAINEVIKETFTAHQRIVFNGDNYTQEWEKMAEERGLPNIKKSVDAFQNYLAPEIITLFEQYNVLKKSELDSRKNVRIERYNTEINIEATSTLVIARSMIIPAVTKHLLNFSQSLATMNGLGVDTKHQNALLELINGRFEKLIDDCNILEKEINNSFDDNKKQADHASRTIIDAMNNVRASADFLEGHIDDELWPLPKYRDMLSIC